MFGSVFGRFFCFFVIFLVFVLVNVFFFFKGMFVFFFVSLSHFVNGVVEVLCESLFFKKIQVLSSTWSKSKGDVRKESVVCCYLAVG